MKPEVHGTLIDPAAFWQAPSKLELNLSAHRRGQCKPCSYFYFKEVVGISLSCVLSQDGCRNGDNCDFCHFCSPQAVKDCAWAELFRTRCRGPKASGLSSVTPVERSGRKLRVLARRSWQEGAKGLTGGGHWPTLPLSSAGTSSGWCKRRYI